MLYGADGELPELGEVRAAAGGALVDVATTQLPDGWGEDWRSFHKPVDVPRPARPAAVGAGHSRARWTS